MQVEEEGGEEKQGDKEKVLEMPGSRIEAWKNMQMKENKWKMREGKNAKMRRDCICDFEGSMEELAAGPAAGEVHKLRTPRPPRSSSTCDLMSSAQCRGQGGRERSGESQGSHSTPPDLLSKVISTKLLCHPRGWQQRRAYLIIVSHASHSVSVKILSEGNFSILNAKGTLV